METRAQIAERLKHRFDWLQQFSDEELREISMCLEEKVQREGEHYFDLSHPEQGVIVGQAGQPIPEGACFVARSTISQGLWNKLVSTAPKQ